jgi:hypothetical protein
MPSVSLCGGTADGTKRISSSRWASRTSSAARRCPRWMGLKVPPRMPMPPRSPAFLRRGPGPCRARDTCRS